MAILQLAKANLRKGKSAAISLFVLIFISSLLLHMGLSVMLHLQSFYDQKTEDLRDPHMSAVISTSQYLPEQQTFLENYSGVVETEQERALLLRSAALTYGGSELTSAILLVNKEGDRAFPPSILREQLDNKQDNDIFVPYRFQAGGGYQLGDTMTITFNEGEYIFRVAGFYEATMLGSIDMGIFKLLMPEQSYHKLEQEWGEQADATLLSARLSHAADATKLIDEFNRLYSPSDSYGSSSSFYWIGDIVMMKTVGTMTVNIVAMILVAFAAVTAFITFVVVYFQITNSLDDEIVNIGVLKSLGYTSKQIIAGLLLQFAGVSLFAGLAGVLLSHILMPFFGGVILSLSGLQWQIPFQFHIAILAVLSLIVMVLAVTSVSARRILRLLPVTALRQGITTHHFNRNFFALDRTKGQLDWLLACKSLVQSGKQNLIIAGIVTAVTFASVFSVVLYYNAGVEKTPFLHMVGSELSDVVVNVKPESDAVEVRKKLEAMEGVAKVTILDIMMFDVDGKRFYANVSDDYGQLDNQTVYEGRYPLYDNEVVISGTMAKQMEKGIGDEVIISIGGESGTYLVTGFSQSINFLGLVTSMTEEGVRRIAPEYSPSLFHVYLDHGSSSDFISSLQKQHSDIYLSATDMKESIESQSGVYVQALFAIMVLILSLTIVVVFFILYLVIKTMLIKRKREMGIKKALGFTNRQLMHQLAIGFAPTVLIGSALGSLLGAAYTNKLLAVLLSGQGIFNVSFSIPSLMIGLLSLGIVILSYIFAWLLASRIRRISPYSLLVD